MKEDKVISRNSVESLNQPMTQRLDGYWLPILPTPGDTIFTFKVFFFKNQRSALVQEMKGHGSKW